MKRTFALPFALLLMSACSGEAEEASSASPIPEVSVAEAAARIAAGTAVAVDANGSETRSERGVVPGARLLTSSGHYDPAAELPEDHSTSLIFYCANTQCAASDGAAHRARNAGYEDVSVMREGIAGWVEAGNETETPSS